MGAQLTITYRDKSRRRIILSEAFFKEGPIMTMRGKTETSTPQERALKLAEYLGPHPYTIVLTKGEKTLMNHTNSWNEPMTEEERRKRQLEINKKREQRESHKGKKKQWAKSRS